MAVIQASGHELVQASSHSGDVIDMSLSAFGPLSLLAPLVEFRFRIPEQCPEQW